MRLDFVNHQIQDLRLSLIDSTIPFEQQDFLRRIAEGWNPSEAHAWLSNEQRERSLSSGSSTFIAALADLISQDADRLPPTFTLDYVRLRTLQADFHSLKYRTACLETLKATLKNLKWTGAIPQSSYDNLFARIFALSSNEVLKNPHPQNISDAALEVVREAYKLSRNDRVPDKEDLTFAQDYLRDSCEGNNGVFEELEGSLGDRLHKLVEQEIDTIGNLTPVQIINHYAPQSKSVNERNDLLSMAQRIAHIAVLHWRIWAPMIYKQPLGPRFEEGLVSQKRRSPDESRSRNGEMQATRRGSAVTDI
ncbi:hypothetical protein P7C71_g3487, partial [Lecanoromycetidae sp. Uapishka_2]